MCYASCTEKDDPKDCAAVMDLTKVGKCAESCEGDDPNFINVAKQKGCELCGEVMCKPPAKCSADKKCAADKEAGQSGAQSGGASVTVAAIAAVFAVCAMV